jgi:hypothetical protein
MASAINGATTRRATRAIRSKVVRSMPEAPSAEASEGDNGLRGPDCCSFDRPSLTKVKPAGIRRALSGLFPIWLPRRPQDVPALASWPASKNAIPSSTVSNMRIGCSSRADRGGMSPVGQPVRRHYLPRAFGECSCVRPTGVA